MKSFLHFCFSYLLVASFVLNPVAHASVGAEMATKVGNKLASYETYNDVVADLGKVSPAIADELKDFYAAKGLLTQKLVPVSVIGSEVIVRGKEEVRIRFSPLGAVVAVGDQRREFTRGMPIPAMVAELERLNKVSSFNLRTLFIAEAHAEIYATGIALIAITITAILMGIVTLADAHYTEKKADEVLGLCKNADGASLDALKKSYAVASEYYKKNCVLVNANHIREECAALKKAVQCFADRVRGAGGVNDSARATGKEVDERPATRRPAPRSNATGR